MFWVRSKAGGGSWWTYKALENTGSISRDTGRDIPQLVLELCELKLLSNLLWAQVWSNRSA